MKRLEKGVGFQLEKEPFPHIYLEKFLPENLRESLVDIFYQSNFTTAIGGAPVSNITDDSDPRLIDFRDKFLRQLLIPLLDSIFLEAISRKKVELENSGYAVKNLKAIEFGFLHLTKNLAGTTINSHRDDDRATYQFIFYLGDINGDGIDITELVYSDPNIPPSKYETNRFSDLNLKTFNVSNNSFLCFENGPNSYHCLSKRIPVDRLTLVGSVMHYDVN
jgi:hypothetical protein